MCGRTRSTKPDTSAVRYRSQSAISGHVCKTSTAAHGWSPTAADRTAGTPTRRCGNSSTPAARPRGWGTASPNGRRPVCRLSAGPESGFFGRPRAEPVDPDLVALAEDTLVATAGVTAVEGVRLRWVGHRLRAEAGVCVDPVMNVVGAHAVAVGAHHRLLHGVPKLAEATVHVSPGGPEGAEQHQTLAHHGLRHDQGRP